MKQRNQVRKYYDSCIMRKDNERILIHEQNNLTICKVSVLIPIEDQGLKYTQLRFVDKGNQFIDYVIGGSAWHSYGFNFGLNYFQFENYNIIIKLKSTDYIFSYMDGNPTFRILPESMLHIVKISTGDCLTETTQLIEYTIDDGFRAALE